MVATGYTDTFNRTSSNSLGQADSGQSYSLVSPATQYNVTPGTGSILPASVGDKFGFFDLRTSDVIDVTARVAISAVPATNLATVGFIAKSNSAATNYYNATMMVATGGAVSLRFSKVVSGGLSTISTTTVTGLTYVGNTFYNLRYSIFWSRTLQTNVMQLKLWAVGAAEPGGWMASATDASHTDYTAGTWIGLLARDESAVVGTLTMKYQAALLRSFNMPMPPTANTMCADPAVAYPKQTALESLADAADAAMATIDPFVSLAGLFPRVRISATSVVINTATFSGLDFTTTEFNIGTETNLGYDNSALYLPAGIWLVGYEIRLAEAASDVFLLLTNSGPITGKPAIDFRSNASQSNDEDTGGTGHMSALTYSTDPTNSLKVSLSLSPNNGATTYTIRYMAFWAVKISDYFT